MIPGRASSMDAGKLNICVLKARNMPGQQAAMYVRVISGSTASSAEVHEDRSTTVSLGDLFTLPVTPGQQQIAVEVWLRGPAGAPDAMLGGSMVDLSTLSASGGDVVPIELHDSTGAVRGVLDCTGSITWAAKGAAPPPATAVGYPAPASAPGASSAAAPATPGAPLYSSAAPGGDRGRGPWPAYGAPAPGVAPPPAAAAPGVPGGPPGYCPGTYPQQQVPPGAVPGPAGWPPGPAGPPGHPAGPPPPGYPGSQQLPMAAGYQAPLQQQQQPPMQGAKPPGKPGMPAWGTTAAAAGAGVLGGMLVGNMASHLSPFHHHHGYGGGGWGGGGWGGGNTETIIVENNNGGWGGGGEQVIMDGGGGWGGGDDVVVEDFGGGDVFVDDGGGGDW